MTVIITPPLQTSGLARLLHPGDEPLPASAAVHVFVSACVSNLLSILGETWLDLWEMWCEFRKTPAYIEITTTGKREPEHRRCQILHGSLAHVLILCLSDSHLHVLSRTLPLH